MKRKFIILISAVLMLSAIAVFTGCGREYTITEENSFDTGDTMTEENPFTVYELIEAGNFDDITLTIYYMSFFVFTPYPIPLWELKGWLSDGRGGLIFVGYYHRTVVTGRDLMEHHDLIKRLFAAEPVPTETESIMDARLHYVFEHEKYGEIFSFTASALGNPRVNGVEVESETIFYEVVLPFLPDDIAANISDFLWGRFPGEIPSRILESVREGNLDGISLEISYTNFFPIEQIPARLEESTVGRYDDMKRHREWYQYRVVVDSQSLAEHYELISRLFAAEWTPVRTESVLDANLLYAFVHEEYGDFFGFAAFAGENLVANGIAVAHDDIFFEAVLPFLPDDIAEFIRRGAIVQGDD